jgi:heptosyltransferase-2
VAGAALLARAGVGEGEAFAVLNPGANDQAKRWPAERFAAVADHLARSHGMKVLVNGSPGEAALVDEVVAGATAPGWAARSLPALGVTIGSLKAVVRRARVMVTNDTGPRHIAAAFGVPTVTLHGPTDPRWTVLPGDARAQGMVTLSSRTGLDPDELSDDHPERCPIEGIGVEEVVGAVDRVLVQK